MCWEADAQNSALRVAASTTRLRADSRLRLLLLSAMLCWRGSVGLGRPHAALLALPNRADMFYVLVLLGYSRFYISVILVLWQFLQVLVGYL